MKRFKLIEQIIENNNLSEGNLVDLSKMNKKQLKNNLSNIKEYLDFSLEDYDISEDGDGVTYEIWEHVKTKKLVEIPIEIVRDFDNMDFDTHKDKLL